MTTAAPHVAQNQTDIVNWRPKLGLYLIEAMLLGLFMVSACFFVFLIEHPASPLHGSINSPLTRRALIGAAMGATAIALIYSPPGKRSGALINPAMTLSFLRLGKIDRRDALAYVVAQFSGAAAGVALVNAMVSWVGHPSVHYVATVPGPAGPAATWLAEFIISFLLVMTVMTVNHRPKLAPFTGCFAGLLVAMYITFEAPLSGMSMNPARTFGSAFVGNVWAGWWIYLTAPAAGMLAATELLARRAADPQRLCGRLTHSRRVKCMFQCNCIPGGS
jgi:aquaporin Z